MSTPASPLLGNQHNPSKPRMSDDNIDNKKVDKQPAVATNEEIKVEDDPPTAAWKALLITFIILGIGVGISFATTTYYECALAYGINILACTFCAYPFKTEKYYDFTGMLTFLFVNFFSIFYNQIQWNIDYIRNIILFFMVNLWTLRLGLFLLKRIIGHGGRDARFDGVRDNYPRFLVYWCFQGTWVYFCIMPLLIVNSSTNVNNGNNDITPMDIIGWILWCCGWSIEIIADRQKTLFKRKPENKGKFTNTGLWSISRHPNYFGEIILWWGIAISATSVAQNGGWVLFISPIYTMLLLIFVSGVPMAERSAMKRYGKVDGYIEYTKNVPVLVPFCYCWTCYT